jgi:hypothetical protein
MSLHIASPSRVARSWLLTKLFGPEKGQESARQNEPKAKEMSEGQRERVLDRVYEDIKQDLIRSIKSEIPSLDAAERRIAKRHGIDQVFLNWFVVNSKHWPPMPTKTKKALRALQDVRLWFGAIPDSWSNMRVPEMESSRSRDAAIKEMADWFVKTFVAKVERKFASTLWKKSREVLDLFRGRGKGSSSKASLLLLRDFERRLGRDRFQLKPAVRRVVELFD